MRVLVLMSTYNGEKYLREQIESVFSQQNMDVTILIRDDGSKDSTCNIIDEYIRLEKPIILEKGTNVGCADSFRWLLNKAFDFILEYEYYAFCDQDDVWLPEKLKIACNYLDDMNPNKPCMYCSNLRVVDANLNSIGMKWEIGNSFISKAQSLVCSMATGCTMVFNRKVIEMFHHYQPYNLHIHDLWVMHMCMFLGHIHYDNDSYIFYRQHGNNVIGAKTTFGAKLKSRYNSLRHLFVKKQNENELEAQELLSVYSDLLNDDDMRLISVVANYKKSLTKRIKFLFHIGQLEKQIKRKDDNMFLSLRILLGKV